MFRLIIVEDEEKIRGGLVSLFPWNSLGFEVAGDFNNGAAALEFLRREGADCVLTDIRMPIMDGLQLAEAIEAEFGGRVQVVFLTGFHDYDMMRRAIRTGAQDYLLKPAQNTDLTACFERVRARLEAAGGGEEAAEAPKGYYNQIVHTVKQYVRENLRECTLEKAAGVVGLSPSYLSRVFKDKGGGLFAEFVTQQRMEKAAELMQDVSYKQYEIAYMVGYDNQQNFSRAFRQYYGMSPSKFRNSHPAAADEGGA